MATIYIGNLPMDVKEDVLRKLFSSYGRVQSVRLVRGGTPFKPRNYGLVEMPEVGTAARAARILNGQYFHGKLLHVESYEPHRTRVSSH